MKCVNCGSKTDGNRIVCRRCSGVDRPYNYMKIHKCGSFTQMKDSEKGVCNIFYLCQPIKKALKNEALIDPNLGHVICPYARINLKKIISGKLSEELLKQNYKECIE